MRCANSVEGSPQTHTVASTSSVPQVPRLMPKAKNYGVRSVPAVVIDGKLASCCAERGPEEHLLLAALR